MCASTCLTWLILEWYGNVFLLDLRSFVRSFARRSTIQSVNAKRLLTDQSFSVSYCDATRSTEREREREKEKTAVSSIDFKRATNENRRQGKRMWKSVKVKRSRQRSSSFWTWSGKFVSTIELSRVGRSLTIPVGYIHVHIWCNRQVGTETVNRSKDSPESSV